MRKIEELTELEINNLTDEEVEVMIKYRKAEEGIKFIPEPKRPEYFSIDQPDRTVFSCGLFGDSLVFEDVNDLNALLNTIRESDKKYRLEYDYNKLGSDFKYLVSKINKYSEKWDEVKSNSVYSAELYSKVCELAAQNKKFKEQYESDRKEYQNAIDESKWIEDEIWDRVREVKDKFYKLNNLCWRFKNDYLPLAENNETVAMKFMNKAYSLTTEQEEYVLANYTNA